MFFSVVYSSLQAKAYKIIHCRLQSESCLTQIFVNLLFWDQSLFGTNLAALNVASINVVDDFGDVGFPFEVDECKSSCQTSPTIHID